MREGVFQRLGNLLAEVDEAELTRIIRRDMLQEGAVVVERAWLGILAAPGPLDVLQEPGLDAVLDGQLRVGIDRHARVEIEDVKDGLLDDDHFCSSASFAV